MNSMVTMPQSCRRQSQDHHERIAKVLVIYDHQQIDENRGEHEPDTQILETSRSCSGSARSPELNCRVSVLLQPGCNPVDVRCDCQPEIAALHAGIDIKDRLDVGLAGVGGYRVPFERRHIAEHARNRLAADRQRGGNRVFSSAFRELTLYSGVCTAR